MRSRARLVAAVVAIAAAPAACVGAEFTLATSTDAGTDAAIGPESDAAAPPGDALFDAPIGPIVPAGCEATPRESADVVIEKCGVFVAPSGEDRDGNGTRAAPVRTLGYAIGIAARVRKRVYVCSAVYDEAVTLTNSTDGVAIHGGLACPPMPSADAGDAGDGGDAATDAGAANDGGASTPAWTYVTGSQARLAPSRGVPLTAKQLDLGILLEDFAIEAPPAAAAGGSSLGVLVRSARGVMLRRVHVVAGVGAAGAPGAPGSAAPTPVADDGLGGIGGNPAPGAGGSARVCSCSTEKTIGGKGGDGINTLSGQAGETGTARAPDGGVQSYAAFPTATDDGAGGAGGAGVTACGTGHAGAQPPAMSPGAGGKAGWSLDDTGIVPSGAGAKGPSGLAAQGGGGGGGARTGSGGGGGACGGCGGGGGGGGGAGGSSVGIALSDATSFALIDSRVEAGAGGGGGQGAPGQDGSLGGSGAAGSNGGCFGGNGGRGGKGGGGGGGAGGASFAIVYRNGAPTTTTTTLITGTSGQGGTDGNGGVAGRGDNGTAAEAIQL